MFPVNAPCCAISRQVSATSGHQPQPQFQDFIRRVFDNSANALELSNNDCHSSTAVTAYRRNSYHYTLCVTTAKCDNKMGAQKTERELAILLLAPIGHGSKINVTETTFSGDIRCQCCLVIPAIRQPCISISIVMTYYDSTRSTSYSQLAFENKLLLSHCVWYVMLWADELLH